VGAAVLLFCGGVMYWLAFGRSGATMDPHRLLELDSGWSHEAPAPPEAGADQEPPAAISASAETAAAPTIQWAAPPRVADATAAPADPAPAPSQPAAAEPSASFEQGSPNDGHATAPTTSTPPTEVIHQPLTADVAVAAGPGVQVTPTPQVDASPYPVTPYAAFDFVNPADFRPAAVADRSVQPAVESIY
jgi:hypothetical protein